MKADQIAPWKADGIYVVIPRETPPRMFSALSNRLATLIVDAHNEQAKADQERLKALEEALRWKSVYESTPQKDLLVLCFNEESGEFLGVHTGEFCEDDWSENDPSKYGKQKPLFRDWPYDDYKGADLWIHIAPINKKDAAGKE